MNCPHCALQLEIAPKDAGKTLRCPSCHNFYRVKPLEFCPACGERFFDKAVEETCTNCGFHFETQSFPDALPEQAEMDPDDFTFLQKLHAYLSDNYPGLLRLTTLLGFLICLMISLVTLFFGVVIQKLDILPSAIALNLIALLAWLHGIGFLCTGRICSLRNAFEYMRKETWSSFLVPVLLFFFLIVLVMMRIQNVWDLS